MVEMVVEVFMVMLNLVDKEEKLQEIILKEVQELAVQGIHLEQELLQVLEQTLLEE